MTIFDLRMKSFFTSDVPVSDLDCGLVQGCWDLLRMIFRVKKGCRKGPLYHSKSGTLLILFMVGEGLLQIGLYLKLAI